MIKTAILVLFLSITTIGLNAQEKWFLLKINDKVSVNFPGEQKKMSETSYGFIAKDSTIYVTSVVNLLESTKMDLATFNTNVVTEEFLDGFMVGLTPTMPGFEFKDSKITKVKELPAYKIIGRNNEKKKTISMTVVFVDGIAYTLACLLSDGKDATDKNKFIAGEIYITK